MKGRKCIFATIISSFLSPQLHSAALASLKGDIVELNKRLQQTERERDLLEKKLAKAQCEQSHLMREHEDVQERTTLRYEERITELHSIIAELNKKIDRLQGTTIREEDEYSELRSELSQSQHEVNEDSRSMDQDQTSVSIPENQSTMVTADMDNCSDLNSELQRVLTGLENVVCGRKKSSCSLSVAEVDRHIEQLTTASEHCDLAIKTVEEIEGVLGRDLYPNLAEERSRWEKELAGLREENESLTAMLCSKEEELNRTKATMNAIREERDRLRRRVRELQTRLQSVQATGPSSPGRLTSTNRPINPSTGELSTSSSSNDIPIAKIAERVKLSKTRSESSSSDRPVLGSEISSIGVSSSVAEHLAHSLQDCSNIQEIFQTLYSHGSAISESKIREFEVETERLNSRIEHLKSQNDLLTITLEECKSNAERMSMLVGKYESNATALRLALQYSEQCIEAYELLLALAESEQSLILGQFRAAGVGSSPGDQSGDENITQMLKRAHDCRKTAENAAKALLMKLDWQLWRSLCRGRLQPTPGSAQPSVPGVGVCPPGICSLDLVCSDPALGDCVAWEKADIDSGLQPAPFKKESEGQNRRVRKWPSHFANVETAVERGEICCGKCLKRSNQECPSVAPQGLRKGTLSIAPPAAFLAAHRQLLTTGGLMVLERSSRGVVNQQGE
ncbi:hypothetical protein H8959_021159 [Pygathrix nigripes]